MGRGRTRAREEGVSGQSSSLSTSASLNVLPGPVYYPTEEEFEDPLEFIFKIRPEAERYGICKIVPPSSWKPPFALDLDSFTFPTKTQAIHQLQARCAPVDPETFYLEYNRFLEEHGGRKGKKRVVFDGEDLEMCKLFNAVKRFGGYDKVVKEKKWGEVFRFVRSGRKITECAKHVLCQLYREHLYDYEEYLNKLSKAKAKSCKRVMRKERARGHSFDHSNFKRRRKDVQGEGVDTRQGVEEELDQICEQCRSGLHGEVMLLCDRCNKGWHLYCLSPPLKQVPPGNWYCLECLNSDKESFGFVPGKQLSLEAFKRIADRARKKWFSSASPSRVQLEKKFWEIVEGSAGEVEVMYGNDLDTSLCGSGFPRLTDQRPPSVGVEEWNGYCQSPWNLNNLPKLKGSMLRAVHHGIAGVMVPWLYIGMLFSSFCWHFEDHCFYSMNYLHWGEPKCWYSVPGSEACAFEEVMRKSLPDLFDSQPDLLFQLVTMLSPSVLQENGVPVYSVLQDPGNFVVTFPRSYHGGFNFGLNCAEAVNFAPADWLHHGGIGAGLYKLYHKAAVLSHEELLCVVARSEFDRKTSLFLRAELLQIYDKEKSWREQLWKNGIINSSPLSPRKEQEYAGTEEDPTCIICQQYLYLSAITCSCRPSAFVCIEHWEHLCECKPNNHKLLYRHTLAELQDLVHRTDNHIAEESAESLGSELPCCNGLTVLSKKVNGGYATHVQLAEEWLLKSCEILRAPYSLNAYDGALKEAEQFLWAGSEMDPVRDMSKNLIEAKKWAEAVNDCLSKLKSWSCSQNSGVEKVQMELLGKLLGVDPLPCNEPHHLKLKDYQQDAKQLIHEIGSVFSKSSRVYVSDLEVLSSKVVNSPIFLKESEKLLYKLSSVKSWAGSVRECIYQKSPGAVGADVLYKLEKQMVELQVEIPECEMLLDLIRRVETCRSQCVEVLKHPIRLKKLELLLNEWDGFTINILELELLKQYYSDTLSWISRVNHILLNVHERKDQESVVDELTCIWREGSLLKIQVEELPRIDVELKNASCRAKALKALRCKMSTNVIQQLLMEACTLQIDNEKLFADISEVHSAALLWEERAKHVLGSEAEMCEFEDVMRASEDIHAVLPSLANVEYEVSRAKSWLVKSKPYLLHDSSVPPSSNPLLKLETLKELVSESKLLRIALGERRTLEIVLDNCSQWEQDSCSLLDSVECLLNMDNLGDSVSSGLISKIEFLMFSLESVTEAGLSLHFELNLIPKLQDARSTLKWCLRALSFCTANPVFEEVHTCLEVARDVPVTYTSCNLWISINSGINWLKKTLEVLRNFRRFKLSDIEETLRESQKLCISFPVMVDKLQNSIENHNLWLKQVHQFFNLNLEVRSWISLLQLKELGNAFDCSELDLVLSEIHKIEKWKKRCKDIFQRSSQDEKLLHSVLDEIRNSLDRSLVVYGKIKYCKAAALCIYCYGNAEEQKLLTCFECKHCFHLKCIGPSAGDEEDAISFVCPYCNFFKSGTVPKDGCDPLNAWRSHPDFNELVKLLSDSETHCLWVDERAVVQEIVEKASACNACLEEIVDLALAYHGKDLGAVTEKLSVALKAVNVAGIFDYRGRSKFELALAGNAWKIRALKAFGGLEKPSMQQVQQFLREGLALRIHQEDYFRRRLEEMKHISLQWADAAKKVSRDEGALGLDKVFELIGVGENLPLSCEKELELLRDRSMLYCICRKPYDRRAMIACDKCDEWYHFDCIKLTSVPEVYYCHACCFENTDDFVLSTTKTQKRLTCGKFEEPQTPSPQHGESRRKSRHKKSITRRKVVVARDINCFSWTNRKHCRRDARKRSNLDSLSPFVRLQNS